MYLHRLFMFSVSLNIDIYLSRDQNMLLYKNYTLFNQTKELKKVIIPFKRVIQY